MILPSDEAIELLDAMVELQTVDAASAATSTEIMHSLDISDIAEFSGRLRELINGDYVKKRAPSSIRETVAYYVNLPKLDQLLKFLDAQGDQPTTQSSGQSSRASEFKLFEEQVMLTLYRAWQDGNSLVSFGRVLGEAGIEWQKGWLVRVHDSLRIRGFVEGPANRRVEEMTAGGLTAQGLQYVEDHLLPGESSVEPANAVAKPFDSTTWTGLPRAFQLTEEKLTSIVRELDAADSALSRSQAAQHDQAQAHAYIVAAKALLEAPEPEPEIAWNLIQRANNLAGIASLFVAIIALFVAA